eukprot:940213-Prorocentrum_minimum.AAC.2
MPGVVYANQLPPLNPSAAAAAVDAVRLSIYPSIYPSNTCVCVGEGGGGVFSAPLPLLAQEDP